MNKNVVRGKEERQKNKRIKMRQRKEIKGPGKKTGEKEATKGGHVLSRPSPGEGRQTCSRG